MNHVHEASLPLSSVAASVGTCRIMVYAHTHWDREWYRSFERFRMQLVSAVDGVVEALTSDNTPLPAFTLDGQTIVLDDYLRIKPERRSELVELARAGRLDVGPWYILPDEFLVSGEAMVRNLLAGRRGAAAFREPMRVGYLPDPFGHVQQLPQILAGFGIEAAIFSRGMDDRVDQLGTEFDWDAPDGSSVVAIVQTGPGITGYCNGERLAQARGDEAETAALAGAESLLHVLARASTTGVLLVAAGCDHETVNPNLPSLVERIGAAHPDCDVALGSLGDIVDEVLTRCATLREDGRLGRTSGELRGARHAPILAAIASARMHLKRDNVRLQRLLARYVDPLVAGYGASTPAFARAAGPLARYAWQLALQNQPHDSIGGCSVDVTHVDMPPRTKRACDIAEGLLREVSAFAGCASGSFVVNPHGAATSGLALTMEGAPRYVGDVPALSVVDLHAVPPAAGGASVVDAHTVRSNCMECHADVEAGRVTVSLLDPDTGVKLATLNDALTFVDLADAGDEYDFGAVPGDVEIRATLVSARPRELPGGAAELAVTHEIVLPVALAADRVSRSTTTSTHRIVTTLIVADDQPWAECHSSWLNHARDHRLRARIALPEAAAHSVADGQFGAAWRSAGPMPAGAKWAQIPHATYPMEHWVAPCDEQARSAGVLFLGEALHEYELAQRTDGKGRALDVTILRCTGWLSRDDIAGRPGHAGPAVQTPAAQCLGSQSVRFGIAPQVPAQNDVLSAPTLAIAERFATPLLVLEAEPPSIAQQTGSAARLRDMDAVAGALPLMPSSVTGAQIATIKLADDDSGDVIVRLVNVLREPAEIAIELPFVADCTAVALDEVREDSWFDGDGALQCQHTGDVPTASRVSFHLRAGGIATLRYRRPLSEARN